jgi:hypothetical protein
MPEEPPDEKQQVQVAIEGGRHQAAHSKPGLEERPVERTPVVGDQAGSGRRLVSQGVEEGALLRVVREQQLNEAQPIALPSADPDQESDSARGVSTASASSPWASRMASDAGSAAPAPRHTG